MEDSVKQRLKLYLEESGIKDSDFCRSIEVSSGYISGMRKSIQPDKLKSIAIKYPKMNIGWLMTGVGDKYINWTEEGIPLYRTSAAAGFGSSSFSIEKRDIEGYYKVREFSSANFMHYIKGDSMIPTYKSGDIVAVKTVSNKSDIQWGRPHLISTPDGLLVKRIYDNDNRLVAVSDNPAFPPRFYDWEDVDGVAVVLGSVRIEGL